ncbi:MGMT family protein [Pedobacter sp. GR22-6]|uniref:MGMT family protein n=1 Tax=Pedobacter sp. GR22-6 TaxID=3127957 RepID=UPI00307EEB7F
MTPDTFYYKVYEIVRLIPIGRVTTYGTLAKALGTARSSSMVGTAMIQAHDPRLQVPAHRVVNKNGLLTGKHHYETPTQMQELLEAEGIIIEDDQVKDFKKVFWNPLLEL